MRRREFIKAMAVAPIAGLAAPAAIGDRSRLDPTAGRRLGVDPGQAGGDRTVSVWVGCPDGRMEMLGWATDVRIVGTRMDGGPIL